ncbi:MAG: ATP-binding protein, partial [Candidatus Dormiibacterota bacterium]
MTPGPAESLPGSGLHRLISAIPRLPGEPTSEAVPYSPKLIAYVSLVTLGAAVAAALTLRPPVDPALLVVGGCATFALAATAVRDLFGVHSHWSVSTFAHLGLSLSAGPPGALVAALGELVGVELRFRNGWFRGAFNASHDFLGNLAAWAVFHTMVGGGASLGVLILAGLTAGACQYAINIGLLAVVQRLTNPDLNIVAFVGNNAANVLPYHLGAGCTAVGATILVAHEGAGGFVLLLIPVGLLQAFLLVLAARTRAAQAQREAHLRERELLLERAVQASEAERRRIVRNLHDGVVQDLAAVALGLRSRVEQGTADIGVMLVAAEATAEAMEELRTLLREIAPPDLQETGLAHALEELAEPLRERGIKVDIGVDRVAQSVTGRALDAAFRIAQEALRNVTEHARAAHVRVQASQRDARLDLEIADDGVGFTSEDRRRQAQAGHLGLALVHDLAREAGGELTVESAPRRGTTLRAWLP